MGFDCNNLEIYKVKLYTSIMIDIIYTPTKNFDLKDNYHNN
jgi:hypothetical protein